MTATDARATVARFFALQREMYAGGALEPVVGLLAEDVVWHVPGTSPIAGDHRGRDAVARYFARRRRLAGGAIHVTTHGELAGDDVVVQLADGRAVLGGRPAAWRTAGVYRVIGERIAEAWLVPLDADAFDAVWARTRRAPFVHRRRVDPQHRDARGFLKPPRALELLEDAVAEWWRARTGGLQARLGDDRCLTPVAIRLDHVAPVCLGDELRVEVSLDGVGSRSVQVHFGVFVGRDLVARAGSTYACLVASTGVPAELPAEFARALEA